MKGGVSRVPRPVGVCGVRRVSSAHEEGRINAMATTDPKLWEEYKVGEKGKNPNWVNPDCVPLNQISHVTHIENALQIAKAGRISAGLVYDESTLNTSRTTVVWLSPNDWSGAGGSRYGNVEFVFDWRDIIKGMNAYRIEVQEYTPRAFRILLTPHNRDADFTRYDLEKGPGPLRFDKADDMHRWNGGICLEIMVEAPISLDRCLRVKFCKHHMNRCCVDPNACKDRGRVDSEGGALFVSGLIARCISADNLNLTEKVEGKAKATSHLRGAWEGIYRVIRHDDGVKYSGRLAAGSRESQAVARSVMSAISIGNDNDLYALSGLFRDRKEIIAECAGLLERHFKIDIPHLLDHSG